MLQSLFSAKSGMSAQQLKLDTIANNIANINTYGYKSSSVTFKDALYKTMINPDDTDSEVNLQQGTGVLLSATSKSFEQGSTVDTGNELDFMIDGEGFFTLSNENGEQYYTRNGAFSVSAEGDSLYLVNANGDYVLDTDLNRIEIPADASEINVNAAGEIYADETLVATMNVVSFPNTQGLLSVGNGYYAETEASGEPFAAEDAEIYQGALEGSNVDLASEMVKLIRAQRAFSLMSTALQTSDDMAATANNMR